MRLATRKDDAFTGPSISESNQKRAKGELLSLPPAISATDFGLFIGLGRL